MPAVGLRGADARRSPLSPALLVGVSTASGTDHNLRACHRQILPPVRGNDRAELQSPTADRLVGHVDTSLGEHVLDVAVAQRKSEIQPDGVLDDLGWKAVAVI